MDPSKFLHMNLKEFGCFVFFEPQCHGYDLQPLVKASMVQVKELRFMAKSLLKILSFATILVMFDALPSHGVRPS
jgi:hypothetical protein